MKIYKRKKLKGLSLDQSLEMIMDVVKNNITHQDYDRTITLRDDYTTFITGEGLNEKLLQFVPREDDIMFEQRCRFTKSIIPSVCAKLMKPSYKLTRVEPVIEKIDWEGDAKDIEDKKLELQYNLDNYNGSRNLKDYLNDKFITSNWTDPNSWELTTYDAFDNKTEKAAPYPIHIPCDEAYNFKMVNNETQWLITRWDMKYMVSDLSDPNAKKIIEKDGYEYRLWTFDFVIKYVQVDPLPFESEPEGTYFETDAGKFAKMDKERVFMVVEVEHKAGFFPGYRNGVKQDLETDGRIMVNMFHEALLLFEKILKVGSEMDISMTLHAFLQKLAYQPPCPGIKLANNRWNRCTAGELASGGKCTNCNGTGFIVHKSSQDAIYLPMPRAKEDMLNIKEMVTYVDIPINILEFDDKYIDKVAEAIVEVIYVGQVFQRNTTASTATEERIKYESVYDTLTPLGNGLCRAYKISVRAVAVYIDLGTGLIVEYKLPKDYQFRTLNDLLTDLKLANDSGAPAFMKQEINNQIAKSVYMDKPDELKRMMVKQRFAPFEGMGVDEIQYNITNKLCPVEAEVLYANSKAIFEKLESDAKANKLWFYDIEESEQRKLLDAVVASFVKIIEDRQVVAMPADFNFNQPNPPAGA
jgi:hypothetical protein